MSTQFFRSQRGFVQFLPLLLLAAFAVSTFVVTRQVQKTEIAQDIRSQASGQCVGDIKIPSQGIAGCNGRSKSNCEGVNRLNFSDKTGSCRWDDGTVAPTAPPSVPTAPPSGGGSGGGTTSSGCPAGQWSCNNACADSNTQNLFNSVWCDGKAQWTKEAGCGGAGSVAKSAGACPGVTPGTTPATGGVGGGTGGTGGGTADYGTNYGNACSGVAYGQCNAGYRCGGFCSGFNCFKLDPACGPTGGVSCTPGQCYDGGSILGWRKCNSSGNGYEGKTGGGGFASEVECKGVVTASGPTVTPTTTLTKEAKCLADCLAKNTVGYCAPLCYSTTPTTTSTQKDHPTETPTPTKQGEQKDARAAPIPTSPPRPGLCSDELNPCPAGQFCKHPEFQCRYRLGNGEGCLEDRVCASNICSSGKCVSASLPACPVGCSIVACGIGTVKNDNYRCNTSAGICCLPQTTPVGDCTVTQRGSRTACGGGRYCGSVENLSLNVYRCFNQKEGGADCTNSFECISNQCGWVGFKRECIGGGKAAPDRSDKQGVGQDSTRETPVPTQKAETGQERTTQEAGRSETSKDRTTPTEQATDQRKREDQEGEPKTTITPTPSPDRCFFDSDCSSSKYCNALLRCVDKASAGSFCVRGSHCQSNQCSLFRCVGGGSSTTGESAQKARQTEEGKSGKSQDQVEKKSESEEAPVATTPAPGQDALINCYGGCAGGVAGASCRVGCDTNFAPLIQHVASSDVGKTFLCLSKCGQYPPTSSERFACAAGCTDTGKYVWDGKTCSFNVGSIGGSGLYDTFDECIGANRNKITAPALTTAITVSQEPVLRCYGDCAAGVAGSSCRAQCDTNFTSLLQSAANTGTGKTLLCLAKCDAYTPSSSERYTCTAGCTDTGKYVWDGKTCYFNVGTGGAYDTFDECMGANTAPSRSGGEKKEGTVSEKEGREEDRGTRDESEKERGSEGASAGVSVPFVGSVLQCNPFTKAGCRSSESCNWLGQCVKISVGERGAGGEDRAASEKGREEDRTTTEKERSETAERSTEEQARMESQAGARQGETRISYSACVTACGTAEGTCARDCLRDQQLPRQGRMTEDSAVQREGTAQERTTSSQEDQPTTDRQEQEKESARAISTPTSCNWITQSGCSSDQYCSFPGQCVEKKATGACTLDRECTSNRCDGVPFFGRQCFNSAGSRGAGEEETRETVGRVTTPSMDERSARQIDQSTEVQRIGRQESERSTTNKESINSTPTPTPTSRAICNSLVETYRPFLPFLKNQQTGCATNEYCMLDGCHPKATEGEHCLSDFQCLSGRCGEGIPIIGVLLGKERLCLAPAGEKATGEIEKRETSEKAQSSSGKVAAPPIPTAPPLQAISGTCDPGRCDSTTGYILCRGTWYQCTTGLVCKENPDSPYGGSASCVSKEVLGQSTTVSIVPSMGTVCSLENRTTVYSVDLSSQARIGKGDCRDIDPGATCSNGQCIVGGKPIPISAGMFRPFAQ